ncbi:hypothetical protein FNAPI_2508 [Fusarium napiforme]|uniref:Uncharacterized protein n=1 Tax=Fusarium napiforme TaxID=42672 RepID=A0A8H5K2D4_9HYPO|nr:hypothetical protein FNAPI_2508 [Fusarium napiforme]
MYGQIARNAIGAAENALLLAELVKNFLDKGVTPELRQKATSILTTMGGTQGLTTGLNIIIGEQSPELAPSSIDSVLRTAHAGRNGSSSSTSKKFNDKPIPTDLTGSSSKNRRVTDHDSDEDLLGALNAPTKTPTKALPIVPRLRPAAPYIIKDSIAFGNDPRAVYSLVSADEVMIFLSDDAAQMFGHLLFTLRKKISPSLPLLVAARMAGIGKPLVLSIDLPLLIPYPGSTAMTSYVTSISDISIFNNMDDAAAAQTFCALLLSLRKKILPSLPLSAVARIAGVDKSLIISIDMPLYIPNPDSTAMASYVSSIAGIGFFANEADTRQLARGTASSMRA